MKKKKCSFNLVIYELKNIMGNPFTLFFGIGFPIIMSIIITSALKADISNDMMFRTASTAVFINFIMVIPIAVILLGYAANYSQELEKEIPLRMLLFGFTQRTIITAKIIAQLIGLTGAIMIYIFFSVFTLDLLMPSLTAAISLILCIYINAVILFLLAHGLSTIFKKFGPTYCVAMLIYFILLMLCGMMGMSVDKYPVFLQNISYTIPITYICNDFINFWQKGSYNYMPLAQSFLFIFALTMLLLLFAVYKDRRVIKSV